MSMRPLFRVEPRRSAENTAHLISSLPKFSRKLPPVSSRHLTLRILKVAELAMIPSRGQDCSVSRNLNRRLRPPFRASLARMNCGKRPRTSSSSKFWGSSSTWLLCRLLADEGLVVVAKVDPSLSDHREQRRRHRRQPEQGRHDLLH